MNKIELTGRLTADPELRYSESGKAFARFTLAVQRDYKNKDGEYDADFFNIVAWDKRAETISKSVKKGHRLAVVGKVRNRSYEASDGSKRYYTEVELEEFDYLESKPKEELPEPEYHGEPESDDPFKDFGNSIDITEDDLPF